MSGFGSTSNVRFCCCCCAVGLVVRRAAAVHKSTGQGSPRRSGSRGELEILRKVAAVGVIARQQPWPMEYGEPGVWILAHFDARLDVMSSRLARGQLEAAVAEDDGVVAGHHPFLLDAQDLGEDRRVDCHEGHLR